MNPRVLVLSGGASSEHAVSAASGADVAAALRRSGGYDVVDVHIDLAGAWHVGGPDAPARRFEEVLDALPLGTVVFPVLHGGWGEGGGLQSVLELRGIDFVGCDADSSARALSKRETLRTCAAAGVRGIPTRALTRAQYVADPDVLSHAVRSAVSGPVVVKPDTGGSSIGVHVVPAERGIRHALDDVFAQDSVALVQPLVMGREVSVGVWTDADGAVRATGASLLHLPQGQEGDGFTYEHKYEGGGAVLEIPASLPADVIDALREQALRAFAAMGCRGLARIDSFVDEQGQILLNEINTMPGLRRASHFPRLVAAAGRSYDRLLEILVAGAGAGAERGCDAAEVVSR